MCNRNDVRRVHKFCRESGIQVVHASGYTSVLRQKLLTLPCGVKYYIPRKSWAARVYLIWKDESLEQIQEAAATCLMAFSGHRLMVLRAFETRPDGPWDPADTIDLHALTAPAD